MNCTPSHTLDVSRQARGPKPKNSLGSSTRVFFPPWKLFLLSCLSLCVRASERLSSSKCIFHLTQRQASPSSTPPPVILCFCSGLLLLSRVIKPATRARGLVPQWRALPVKRLQRQSAVVWSLMSRVCVKMYFSMKSVKVHKACISATEPIQDLLCKIGRNASFLIYHIFRAVWFV